MSSQAAPATINRIAVGIDGYPEGRDAAVLGATIASATAAELMLVAVHPDPLVVLPSEVGWKGMREQAETTLRETRDSLAPGARTVVETDFSIARALERVIKREQRDLLVVGSSRHGPEGRVRIGKRTRQLLCHSESALAVAPRGMADRDQPSVRRVGVGYDGGAESHAALVLAGAIAGSAGSTLRVQGVVDDRMPPVGWSALSRRLVAPEWDDVIDKEIESLRANATSAAAATGASAEVDVVRGRPADALLKLCNELDLLVVGSRRWGSVARLMLGSTGEALLHDATCPVLVVPRPAA